MSATIYLNDNFLSTNILTWESELCSWCLLSELRYLQTYSIILNCTLLVITFGYAEPSYHLPKRTKFYLLQKYYIFIVQVRKSFLSLSLNVSRCFSVCFTLICVLFFVFSLQTNLCILGYQCKLNYIQMHWLLSSFTIKHIPQNPLVHFPAQ